MLDRSTHAASRLFVQRPFKVLGALLVVAASIEILQEVPEVVAGGHAFGEVIRNLAYALIGALIFQWLVVELPARKRRRMTYDFSKQVFQILLMAGPGLLEPYRQAAKLAGQGLDVWDQGAIVNSAKTTMSTVLAGSADRVKVLQVVIDTAIPRALSELSASVAYIDPEVAHALSMFPRQDGLVTVLQILPTPGGGIDPERDAHIVWTLLEAARRLYAALLDSGAYDSTIFQAVWSSPLVGDQPLSDDSLVRPTAQQ